MAVVTVRLEKIDDLDQVGKILHENRSEVIRDLVTEGRKMKALELYKKKKISIGLAAKLADLSLSEFLDLIGEYNLHLNIDLEDAQLALRYAKRIKN